MYIKSYTNSQPEVTDYKNSNKLLKLMMNWHYWNIQLCQDGPALSKKYHKFYTHIGHVMRNSLKKMASS